MKFEDLQKAMIAAMKAHEADRKETISLLVAAVKKVAIDAGERDNITEEMVDSVLLKELKSVKEQIDTCPATRQDLLEKYKFNLSVVEEFAPKMLSAEEVEKLLKEKFADVLATGNKGQIMKAVMAELKGKADGKVISEVVAKLSGTK
ncbi:MAG: GatB/YqeY domain-containing protein [Clostridia bacterium]|nr:GatB/YqeY domain-containing protein [Clostridia bacterium]